jgi:hypothetical protein
LRGEFANLVSMHFLIIPFAGLRGGVPRMIFK